MNPPLTTQPPTDSELAQLRRSLGFLGFAIVFNAIGTVARFGPHEPAFMLVGGIAWIGALILSITGVIIVSPGMRLSLPMTVFTCILTLIPFASFIVLLVLRFKAAEALRKAGYSVNLFAANKP